jgi:amino acid transporter
MGFLSFSSGSTFIAQYMPYGLTPTTPFFTMLLSDNVIVQIIIAAGYIATGIALIHAWWIAVSRNIFAWSFDRLVPRSLAYVEPRFHAPLGSIAIIFGVAVVGGVITAFTTWLTWVNQMLMAFWCFMIISVAAIVFPYRRKDLYERSIKWVIHKIPVISILGVLTLIFYIYATYFAVVENPAVTGAPFSLSTWASVIVAFALAPIIYYTARALNKKFYGIDIAMAFKEIPPE